MERMESLDIDKDEELAVNEPFLSTSLPTPATNGERSAGKNLTRCAIVVLDWVTCAIIALLSLHFFLWYMYSSHSAAFPYSSVPAFTTNASEIPVVGGTVPSTYFLFLLPFRVFLRAFPPQNLNLSLTLITMYVHSHVSGLENISN